METPAGDPAELSAIRAHLEAWRDAYRAFGANPRGYRCSAEALVERFEAQGALPSIHPIVDAYDAISLRFGLPIGGEDAMAYRGVPRLVRAVGDEPFDTIHAGTLVTEIARCGLAMDLR